MRKRTTKREERRQTDKNTGTRERKKTILWRGFLPDKSPVLIETQPKPKEVSVTMVLDRCE